MMSAVSFLLEGNLEKLIAKFRNKPCQKRRVVKELNSAEKVQANFLLHFF